MGSGGVICGLTPPLSLVVTFFSGQNTDRAEQRVGGEGVGR